MSELAKFLNKQFANLYPLNVKSYPLSPRSDCCLESPSKVRTFKNTIQIDSMLPSIIQQQKLAITSPTKKILPKLISAPISPKVNKKLLSSSVKQKKDSPRGMKGYSEGLYDKRVNDQHVKSLKRNKIDISRMQFVYNPLLDYPSTELRTFEMLINQQQPSNNKDQLQIHWERIEQWNLHKHQRREKLMNLKLLQKKVKISLSPTDRVNINNQTQPIEEFQIEPILIEDKGAAKEESMKDFFKQKFQVKMDEVLSPRSNPYQQAFSQTRTDFGSDFNSSNGFSQKKLNQKFEKTNYQQFLNEKRGRSFQVPKSMNYSSKMLKSLQSFHPNDQEQQKIVNLEILRELSRLKSKVNSKDKQWKQQNYSRKNSNEKLNKGNIYEQESATYPFQFQGHTITKYEDLLKFCELDKDNIPRCKDTKVFDRELFELIQHIKEKEKIHLRKPSALDNLVILSKVDEYYQNRQ